MGEGTRQWRVLYVSDHGDDPFRDALEAERDLAVVAATDAEGARDQFAPEIDCVVSRHGDGLDGLAVLEATRERWPNCPFVLVADDPSPELAGEAVAADVTEYVPASASESEFSERVAAALAGGDADRSGSMSIEGLSTADELRLKERAMDEAPVGITISDPDRPDNPLVYVNDQFEQVTGYSPEWMRGRNCRLLQGEGTDPEPVAELRAAIDEERPVTVELRNYRKDGSPFWNEVTVAPIRDDDGEVTNYVGFQSDVTARKEAELAVEEERAALEHLLDRLDGLLQDVTADLVEATSREEVETAVCDRLAAVEDYSLAWVGRHDRTRDNIVPSATAGTSSTTEDDLAVDLDTADSPVARAYETGTMQVVTGGSALDAHASADADVEGLVAVPLAYGETVYGVLTVWTTDAAALTDHETAVFGALGRMAATTINALERGRIIGADNVVELELSLTDSSFFLVALSDRTGGSMEYTGAVYHDDGSTSLYVTTDADPEAIERHAADHPEVDSATLVSEGEESLYQFVVGPDSIVGLLAERGAKTRSITASDGQARLRVELPTEADAREMFDLVADRYPGSELVGYHEHERPPRTRQEFVSELEDRLTDRQLTALHTAYVSGFYERKRGVTGDELAEVMDVSRSTFHQHLRAAERKLLDAFFDQTPTRS